MAKAMPKTHRYLVLYDGERHGGDAWKAGFYLTFPEYVVNTKWHENRRALPPQPDSSANGKKNLEAAPVARRCPKAHTKRPTPEATGAGRVWHKR